MAVKEEVTLPSQRICVRCKFVSSQEVCKACVLLEGLNKGLPRLGIGKSSKAKKMLEEYNAKLPRGNELDNIKDESLNNSKSKGKCKNKVNKNKENCGNCSGKCGKETNITDETNSKINNLLKEYGLETSNTANIPTSNQHESDEEQILNEDDGCSGACGKLGSMQIGF